MAKKTDMGWLFAANTVKVNGFEQGPATLGVATNPLSKGPKVVKPANRPARKSRKSFVRSKGRRK